MQEFLADLQKRCLPGIWSKGIALARANAVLEDRFSPTEIVVRVTVPDRPVSPKVQLWPEDEDAFCDCPEFGVKNEICAHIAAAAIYLRSRPAGGPERASTEPVARPAVTTVGYRFAREAGALSLERVLVGRDGESPLRESLVAIAGGISSGRIVLPTLAASREDYALDQLLSGKRGILEAGTLRRILAPLAEVSDIRLDDAAVRASTQPVGLRGRVMPEGSGFRLRGERVGAVGENFKNGVALVEGALRPLDEPQLSPEEARLLSPEGYMFSGDEELARLFAQIIPSLQKRVTVILPESGVPDVRAGIPKVELAVARLSDETLAVTPRITYADLREAGVIHVPDPAAERALALKVRSELHLNLGQVSRFQGQAAADFLERAQGWDFAGEKREIRRAGALKPIMQWNVGSEGAASAGFSMEFQTADGERADAARVFQAWSRGEADVPLLSGGWAKLPSDWLKRYGHRVAELLAARDASGALPRVRVPEALEIAGENGAEIPDALAGLRRALLSFEGIPSSALPRGLAPDIELRSYQKRGVDWLVFLREQGLGALLADDMGLGKTLQALCAIRGRTLVVCPTSVLQSWQEQIERFRPSLRACMYHGSARELDPRADVVLTSYAILRLDLEKLLAQKWGSIIIDEAQTIKNPDSQVARSAHALALAAPDAFRIALSGTPIENRLSDLWSQFRFVNPGLLGTLEDFRESFGSLGREESEKLRRRIRPFVLRRLKREVAPELPPRTETVLRAELSESERELYQSLLAATRQEAAEKLSNGGSVFQILELLLRLRQACCHPALIPGQSAESSSKIALLMETLEESLDNGHRALVFSQWTGLLDLIEPELTRAGVRFSRLDGSTSDRGAVVAEFQRPDGPSVMLISLKAGGVGVTLTAADHVFLLDPWWNPAVEDQAADRAHRIGQKNPVLIHRLVARDTVEDRVLELQKRKLAIAAAVLDGAEAAVAITREDLLELLS